MDTGWSRITSPRQKLSTEVPQSRRVPAPWKRVPAWPPTGRHRYRILEAQHRYPAVSGMYFPAVEKKLEYNSSTKHRHRRDSIFSLAGRRKHLPSPAGGGPPTAYLTTYYHHPFPETPATAHHSVTTGTAH